MNVLVRKAQDHDVPWLIGQLSEFDRFFGSKKPLMPDVVTAREILLTLIRDQLFILAVDREENRLGFIAGLMAPHTFNPNILVLTELFWWVPEEHRRSRAGATLLAAFIHMGQQYADWIIMTLEHGSPVKPESLEKRGFRNFEHSFLLEVER